MSDDYPAPERGRVYARMWHLHSTSFTNALLAYVLGKYGWGKEASIALGLVLLYSITMSFVMPSTRVRA